MKKILVAVFLVALMSTPAFALFTNGGFEDGNLNGWTVSSGYNYGYYYPPATVTSSTIPDPLHVPYIPSIYNGTYMARLNDAYGMYDWTRIEQTDTVDAADIAAGGVLSVNWGTVLDDPEHPASAQPHFDIEVKKNGVTIASFSANASAHGTPGSGWTDVGDYAYSGDDLWYKAGQFQLNMSNFVLGDQVTVSLGVYDCGYGGHGGYAFLDGIQSGTPPPPPPGVPEPASLLLLGFGLAGIGFMRRKQA